MKIKVCGMRDPENIREVCGLRPDYIGFIFYPQSKRYAGEMQLTALHEMAPEIRKTGVFVNNSLSEISGKVIEFGLGAVQLHGNETPQMCEEIKKSGVEVIKAFGIDDTFDFNVLGEYVNAVDYFLFDTKTPAYGGSGRSFNWQILAQYELNNPYFLSGGLNPENVTALLQFDDERLFAADLNSGFELSPGIKNITELAKAFNLLRT